MGSWGTGIREDDYVCDVQADFRDALKKGNSVSVAATEIIRKYNASTCNYEDGGLFWLALADAQWAYGELDPDVLSNVVDIIKSESGLELWEETSAQDLQERKNVLSRFLETISKPNPKPQRIPKTIVQRPKFHPGDCLSIALEDNMYGAALVLATDDTDVEAGRDMLGVLEHYSEIPATTEVFEQRKWFKWDLSGPTPRAEMMWLFDMNFRKIKPHLTLVGNVQIHEDDPKFAIGFTDWKHFYSTVALQKFREL